MEDLEQIIITPEKTQDNRLSAIKKFYTSYIQPKNRAITNTFKTIAALYIGIQLIPAAAGWYDISREKKAFKNSMEVFSLVGAEQISSPDSTKKATQYIFRYRHPISQPVGIAYKSIDNPGTITSLELLNISTSILHRYPKEKNDDCSEYAATLFDIYQKIAQGIGRPDLSRKIRIATGLVEYEEKDGTRGAFGHNWVEMEYNGQWKQYESMKIWVEGLDEKQNLEYSPIRTRFAVTQAGSRDIDFTAFDLSLNPAKGPFPILQYLTKKIAGIEGTMTYDMINKSRKNIYDSLRKH